MSQRGIYSGNDLKKTVSAVYMLSLKTRLSYTYSSEEFINFLRSILLAFLNKRRTAGIQPESW